MPSPGRPARVAPVVGIDTASVDYGPSTDFIVHQVGGAAGIPIWKTSAICPNFRRPGFLLIALPMKIEAGTGAPVRIVALIPPD